MEKLIQYFVPKQLEHTTEYINSKVRYLIISLLSIALASTASITIFTFYPVRGLRFLTILMFLKSIGLLFLLKFTSKIELSSYLFGTLGGIYIFGMIYYTGGVESSFLFWIVTLPVVAIIISLSSGLIYYASGLGILIYLIFLVMGIQGIETPNLIPSDLISTYNVLNQILIMLTVVFILKFYYDLNKSYNERLEVSNENLERFAAVASHDMKAPLRNIINFTQLLKRKIKKSGDEGALEYLGFIENNGKQMENLIQGILNFSKIQYTTELEKSMVDLNEVMNTIRANLKTQIERQDVRIDFAEMPMIKANSLQITQVFQNLIENGLKYNHSQTRKVAIRYQEVAKSHQFFIEDNGIGIEEAYFNKIFEMFQRLHSSAEFQGSGIGLAICKKIALLHGGDLSVVQSSEKGTTFLLSLPK